MYPPAVVHGPQAVVHVHPTLGQAGHGREKDLQFFAACPIYLPQLPKSVGLVHVFGQPVRPEVVDKRPILGHVSHSPHGYYALTGLAKPWPIVQSCATRLGSAVLVVAMVAMVAEYHGGQIIVLARTMYMDGYPMVAWPIQAGQLHAHERSTAD